MVLSLPSLSVSPTRTLALEFLQNPVGPPRSFKSETLVAGKMPRTMVVSQLLIRFVNADQLVLAQI